AGSAPGESHNFLDGLNAPQEGAIKFSAPMIDGKPLTEFVDQREKVLTTLLAAGDLFGKPADILTGGSAAQRSGRMEMRLEKAESAAAGVSARLSSNNQVMIPGENAAFNLELTNNGNEDVRVVGTVVNLEDRPNKELPLRPQKDPILKPGATTTVPITV